MSSVQADNEHVWEKGWDGHKIAQLRRMARLPFSEKLKWLEKAHRMVKNGQIQKTENR